jgi:hypothetical protein
MIPVVMETRNTGTVSESGRRCKGGSVCGGGIDMNHVSAVGRDGKSAL